MVICMALEMLSCYNYIIAICSVLCNSTKHRDGHRCLLTLISAIIAQKQPETIHK